MSKRSTPRAAAATADPAGLSLTNLHIYWLVLQAPQLSIAHLVLERSRRVVVNDEMVFYIVALPLLLGPLIGFMIRGA